MLVQLIWWKPLQKMQVKLLTGYQKTCLKPCYKLQKNLPVIYTTSRKRPRSGGIMTAGRLEIAIDSSIRSGNPVEVQIVEQSMTATNQQKTIQSMQINHDK